MKSLGVLLLSLSALLIGTMAMAEEKAEVKGNVYMPKDGKSFEITDKDVVRFEGPPPGSTGIRTTVKVTEGKATVIERAHFSVVDGKVIRIGGGALEFDVKPAKGSKGTVKVTVTKLPPGDSAKPEAKEYEFEVK